jgi:DNA adenine methylase
MQQTCLKYHGGKAYLAKWIRSQFPKHTRYCEPYFGGGSVLFAGNGIGVAEYANDLNGVLTNFWEVLKDEKTFTKLHRILQATPLSHNEFETAKHATGSCIAQAAAFFVMNRQSRQGLGKSFTTPTSRIRQGMNEQVSAWLSGVEGLPWFHNRLRRVEIRNQTAIDFIDSLDSKSTLFYCDPPYVHTTRTAKVAYGPYEMSEEDHEDLLIALSTIHGKFVLSGYPNPLYAKYAKREGWRTVTKLVDNKSSSSKVKEKKEETLWINY